MLLARVASSARPRPFLNGATRSYAFVPTPSQNTPPNNVPATPQSVPCCAPPHCVMREYIAAEQNQLANRASAETNPTDKLSFTIVAAISVIFVSYVVVLVL